MKVAFRKITNRENHFVFGDDSLKLECSISRKDSNLYLLKGRLFGKIELECDLSGDSFFKTIDQELVLYISDGLWDMQSQLKTSDFDVIEFFDGLIDIEYIFSSEIELIKSDYHIKE
ncbi:MULTISPECIES: hypothetical protein [unclassified Helicobacter]|uniref:hypothetical protein n=1 Tax=unclassified Helicobacter TaxID=2593540 RepID=UPI000CF118D2|nr:MULTISPECIES: hypothetical protein [unclassified Helicobacter]